MGKIILFLFLFSYVLLEDCNVYKCMDDTVNNDPNVCRIANKSSAGELINYNVRLCPSGKICPEKQGENDTITCEDSEKVQVSEGEECEKDDDCARGSCKQNKCVAQKKGESCQKHEDCNQLSYCNATKNICEEIKEKDSECEIDEQCDYLRFCVQNSTSGPKYCLLQYSYEAGKYVLNETICKSGKANGDHICYNTKPVDREEGNECDNNNQCKMVRLYGGSKIEEDFGECKCSVVKKNKKYCSYTTSSEKWERVLVAINDTIDDYERNSTDVLNARKKFPDWGESDINKFIVRFDVKLKGAPDCLFEYFLSSQSPKLCTFLFVLLFSLFYL